MSCCSTAGDCMGAYGHGLPTTLPPTSPSIAWTYLATVPVPPGFSDRVFGVLVFEDLGAVLLLAGLGGLGAMGGRASSEGADHGGGGLGGTVLRLLGFLLGAIVIGQIVIPRVVRATVRLGSPETLLIVAAGLCCGGALLAHSLGFSVALGAFLAGLLAAESGEGARVEHLLRPLRDAFAAHPDINVVFGVNDHSVLAALEALLRLRQRQIAIRRIHLHLLTRSHRLFALNLEFLVRHKAVIRQPVGE